MDLIASLYLVLDDEQLRKSEEKRLQKIWEKFTFCNPNIPYLGRNSVKKAVNSGNHHFFLNQFRTSFFPRQNDDTINEQLRRAINRGIASINELCQKYLGEVAEHFLIDEVSEPFNLFEYVASARDEWIRSRAGRHEPEPELFFSAYKKIRDIEFGYRVLMIDESPEVISAMKHRVPVLGWFQDSLGFEDKQLTGLEGLLYSWQTKAGIRVFGNAAPMRSRIKILDSDSGQLRYSSILMKMLLKGFFPDSITDYAGVELIVENDAAKSNLVNYFRKNVGALSKLEGFEERKGSPVSDNPNSSNSFKFVKFRLHVPVPAEYNEVHPLDHLAYERIPVEMQILTLEDDRQRKFNPDVTHEQYKERQFRSVFPALFPKKVYQPLLQLRRV